MGRHASWNKPDEAARIFEPGQYWHGASYASRRIVRNLPRPAHAAPWSAEDKIRLNNIAALEDELSNPEKRIVSRSSSEWPARDAYLTYATDSVLDEGIRPKPFRQWVAEDAPQYLHTLEEAP